MNRVAPFHHCSYRLTAALELRPLAATEAEMLAARFAEMDPWQGLGFTAKGLERYFTCADAGLYRYAVLKEGALAGVVAVRYPWLRGAYLELLGLLIDAQGQRLGQQILGWLAFRTALEASNLWATVSASNDRARRFYAKQGFVPIGDLPDLVQDGCNEVFLRLRLT
jgi:ribosomal protein S18 acetylase RimI-like enzyme